MVKEIQQPGGSSQPSDSIVWSGIWNLQISNAEKNFMWRACHNLLPTKENLLRRKVVSDLMCPICKLEVETTFHILWGCPSASDVWGVSSRVFQKSTFSGPGFLQVAEGVFQTFGGDEFCVFAETAKRIWFKRNAWIHDGVFLHSNAIVKEATDSIQEFHSTNRAEDNSSSTRVDRRKQWAKLMDGWCKLNCDASINMREGRMGFGMIVRDSRGVVIVARSLSKLGSLELAAAETMALYFGVKLCVEYGIQQIIVEGDAKQVIDAVQASGENSSIFGQLVGDVLVVLNSFTSWKACHVNREANRAAHELARLAILQVIDTTWQEDLPSCISDIVLSEQLLCQ